MEKNIPQEIERFDISARVQHIIMFVTFLILSFTGWGLKYAYAKPASAWITIWGGAKIAGYIHRAAGITMLLDFIYHQFYLLNLARKRDLRLTIIPMPKDVVDLFHNFMYYFGFRKERPYFGKFSYLQKFDYWAVYWGMVIMIGSGTVLWFTNQFLKVFPKWFTDIAKEAHSDEALLATLAIVVWHFYNVHFNPHKFPMNRTFITGRISEHEMVEEHPLEYERITSGAPLGPADSRPVEPKGGSR